MGQAFFWLTRVELIKQKIPSPNHFRTIKVTQSYSSVKHRLLNTAAQIYNAVKNDLYL